MRIIAGSAGGIRLTVPPGEARPTTDRVREALFSVLAARLPDARVLDLFAGSGSLGIEALSRGAVRATFIDRDRKAAACIARNLQRANLDPQTVLTADLPQALGGERVRGPFDLIFADPPYRGPLADALLASPDLPDLIASDGLLVLERPAPATDFDPPAPWGLCEIRTYGSSAILILEPA